VNPILYLTSINTRIDLKTMIADIDGHDQHSKLVRSNKNDRSRSGFSLSDCFEFGIIQDNK